MEIENYFIMPVWFYVIVAIAILGAIFGIFYAIYTLAKITDMQDEKIHIQEKQIENLESRKEI